MDLAKATYVGLRKALPLEKCKWFPEWLSKNGSFETADLLLDRILQKDSRGLTSRFISTYPNRQEWQTVKFNRDNRETEVLLRIACGKVTIRKLATMEYSSIGDRHFDWWAVAVQSILNFVILEATLKCLADTLVLTQDLA